VTYPGFTPVGNATLVVANVLTCNKHSQMLEKECDQLLIKESRAAVRHLE
jgi:hypothetical protein